MLLSGGETVMSGGESVVSELDSVGETDVMSEDIYWNPPCMPYTG